MSNLPKAMEICQAEIDQQPCQHCGGYVLAGCPLGDINACGHQDRVTPAGYIELLKAERDKYRAIALNLIRVYRVDDQAWAPDEEAEKMLEKQEAL